ncbi:rod shape-determining protein MreD [Paenibacillus koleovorans]|uniref:rod shape-determining protein MreD n=1 Tax=Paenibacillus koleovorans TaxID=121608 RepID=UPI000FDA45FB|nr:rod shape-determining protein MreD [Paenibacillus koleovorans]
MRHYWIVLIVLGAFILEGTLSEWILPESWQSRVYVVPHLVLITVLYISIFTTRYLGLTYGLAFGFLQDVVYYGHSIGVYSFSYGLVAYAVGLAFRRVQLGVLTSLFVVLLGNLFYEMLIYGVYRFFLNVIRVDFQWAFMHQMLPSVLFNLLLGLALYLPARKYLEPPENQRDNEEK